LIEVLLSFTNDFIVYDLKYSR